MLHLMVKNRCFNRLVVFTQWKLLITFISLKILNTFARSKRPAITPVPFLTTCTSKSSCQLTKFSCQFYLKRQRNIFQSTQVTLGFQYLYLYFLAYPNYT